MPRREKSPELSGRIKEALEILKAVGVPLGARRLATARRQERLALALMAAADIKPKTPWRDAKIHDEPGSFALTTRETIRVWNEHFEENISSGSYDDVRHQEFAILVEAGLVLKSASNPSASTNDPTRRYGVNPDSRDVLRLYGGEGWQDAVSAFVGKHGDLRKRMERPRSLNMVPVTLSEGQTLELSPGVHNELQKAAVEEFLPRFAPGSEVLYLGDTARKLAYIQEEKLQILGFSELAHDTLPDVVAYYPEKDWILLIEAVHSSNPISSLRHLTLERMTEHCTAPRVYVSIFRNRGELRRWLSDISWETEVWLTESPDHLIHFDGEKFLGPY